MIPFARATTFTRGLPDVASQLRILARESPLAVQHLLDAAELSQSVMAMKETLLDGDNRSDRLLRNIETGGAALERLAGEQKLHLALPLLELLATQVEELERRLDAANIDPGEESPASPTAGLYQQAPTMDEVNNYLVTQLPFASENDLSTVMQQGLYLLLAAGITPEMLAHFWEHFQSLDLLQERKMALQLTAHLYARGALGYDYGFRPIRMEERFFSSDPSNIRAILNLFEIALGYAKHPAIDRVEIGKVMTYDETKLSRRLRGFLATHVDPVVGEKRSAWRIEGAQTPVDLLITTKNGGRRMVKVKSSLPVDFSPANPLAKIISAGIIGQAIYLSLIVGEHQLEGIEYHLGANRLQNEIPKALEEALRMTEIPFVIRFWQHQQIVWQSRRRLNPLPYYRHTLDRLEDPIRRPLPPLPSV